GRGGGASPAPGPDPASSRPPAPPPPPSSQAPTPARKRALTRPRLTEWTLRAGKARLKRFGRQEGDLAGKPRASAWGNGYRPVVAQLLLVEDDAAIRGALIRALTERGHAVVSSPGAMGARRQSLNTPPDLVLLDLGLPDVDC